MPLPKGPHLPPNDNALTNSGKGAYQLTTKNTRRQGSSTNNHSRLKTLLPSHPEAVPGRNQHPQQERADALHIPTQEDLSMQLQPSIDDPDRSPSSTYPPDSHRDRVLQDPVDYTCHRRTATTPLRSPDLRDGSPPTGHLDKVQCLARPRYRTRSEILQRKKKGGACLKVCSEAETDVQQTINRDFRLLRTNPSNNGSAPTLEMDGGPGAPGETDCISACGGFSWVLS